jgi:hypothetical protein
VLRRVLHNVESVAKSDKRNGKGGKWENAPSLSTLPRFATQQRSTVCPYSLRLVHCREELGTNRNFSRAECSQFGVGEGETGEEDVNEGLLDGRRRAEKSGG